MKPKTARRPEAAFLANASTRRTTALVALQSQMGRMILPSEQVSFFHCACCEAVAVALVATAKQATDYIGDGCPQCHRPTATAWVTFVAQAKGGS